MQPLLSPAQELDDEISVSRRLRRMKRRLLLGASYPGSETPPPTPSKAVRTAVNHKRHSINTTPSLSLEVPITPRSVDDEDVSKDLSIRSDPGPSFVYQDTTNVGGVRKLRRLKRRLFLEQLASDNPSTATTSVPPHVATRSVSGPAAISPMKNPSFASTPHRDKGVGIHDRLQSASEIVDGEDGVDASVDDTFSPLPSPRLSATKLRRIKRRLLINHLQSSDLDIGKVSSMDDDDHGQILQKASSSSLNRASAFMDATDASPFLRIDSWSDKVEYDRALKEPPQLRVRVKYPPFPDLNKRKRQRDPQEMTLEGLSSKLEILSLNQAMNYNHQKEKQSALMGSRRKESVVPKADSSSHAAIFI